MPIQIFSYCNNRIWDSRKHFRYPVDTETEKEFVIEQLLLSCFTSWNL